MRTEFSVVQLADPDIQEADSILRKCVHCGFCNATCPTYQLLGDELDGPRGRIYLIKNMLENEDTKPTAPVVKHIDRCLSCLACMTTCPSGVHYMHLVDQAREHIEQHYRRPLGERLVRRLLGLTLPYPARFQLLLRLAGLVKPLASRLPGRLGRMAAMVPLLTKTANRPLAQRYSALRTPSRGTVALLPGCAQQVLGGEINAATVRVLTRLGFDVQVLRNQPCCGAVEHHLGWSDTTRERLQRNVRAWQTLIRTEQLEAIIVNASGCGTMLKDYGYLLRNDPELSEAAALISGKTRDISEFLHGTGLDDLPVTHTTPLIVAYQSPCSLQHGQQIHAQPQALLTAMGYTVQPLPEAHMCCGSAGTYNLLQPEIAAQFGQRKAEHIRQVGPDVIATGNLGCSTQLSHYTDIPIVHTVQLIDWAGGGPVPPGLATIGEETQ